MSLDLRRTASKALSFAHSPKDLVDDSNSAEVQLETPKRRYSQFDFKQPQSITGWQLFYLSVGAVGTIYGDIGTSPLYVYSSTFPSPPTNIQVVSCLSLVIWSLTLMVTLKYACIVLYADDAGEGGTLALYSLLVRYARLTTGDPARPVHFERFMTQDLHRANQTFRSFLEHSKIVQVGLTGLAIAGVCMVLADGVLTPAQSILGAIQGVNIVNPNLSSWTVVGITCAILFVLFASQQLGLNRLTVVYAPIIIIWLLFNFGFGIYNLVKYDASVFKAFNPYYAFKWFTLRFSDGTSGWHNLGGPLLAFTGVEALFADLGSFNRRSIQLSWLCFVYPCLLSAYIGQAANIADNPTHYANPFFLCAPDGWIWPSLIIAILAAIVASQALITATFNLLAQAMNISYFPRLFVRHTSDTVHGQIYIPLANWALFAGCVIVTCAYSNTTRLGNAYGLCVVLVTCITTSLVAIVALIVWRFNPLLVIPGWLFFATFDNLYLSNAIFKVPKGAWFTLLVAGLLAMVMCVYRWGKGKQWHAISRDAVSLDGVLRTNPSGELQLTETYGGHQLTCINGAGLFMDDVPSGSPYVYTKFAQLFNAHHQITIFVHLRQVFAPRVGLEDRFEFKRTGVRHHYRLIARYGYADHVGGESLYDGILPELRKFLNVGLENAPRGSPAEKEVEAEIAELAAAVKTEQLSYILAKNELVLRPESSVAAKWGLVCYNFLRENTRTRPQSWRLPMQRMVELGISRTLD